MYKLDLINMRYTRTVNLANYNCVPTSMEFSDLCNIFLIVSIFSQFLFRNISSLLQFKRNEILFPDGFVILECEEPITGRPTGQVLLDYLTDSVLAHKPSILGKPAISPDSRYLVTLDKQNTGVTLVVQEILRNIPRFLHFLYNDIKTEILLNTNDILKAISERLYRLKNWPIA